MYETCPFSQEEFLIWSDVEKQAVTEIERGGTDRKTRAQTELFSVDFVLFLVDAAKHPKLLFKFPFVVCFYSLEMRRKLALESPWRFLPFTLLQL